MSVRQQQNTPESKSKSTRLLFIDLLRGWGVVLMVEAHVFHGLFDSSSRGTLFFKGLDLLNGFVGPAFLFASGLAFAVTSERKFPDYLAFRIPLFRQMGRLFFILGLAYALHLPYFSFRKLVYEAGHDDWVSFLRVDILHCIVASLLILIIVLLLVRTQRRMFWSIIVLAGIVVLSTPLVWDMNLSSVLPLPIADYLNAEKSSPFPLFPWAGFLWFGAVVGFLYVSSRQQGRERLFFIRLVIAAGVLILGGLLFDNLPIQVYPHYDFWHTSPNWFAIRLGVVMLFCGSLWFLEHYAHYKSWVMAKFGQESLLVYVAHLPIVYGSVVTGNLSLAVRYGQTLSAPQCFGVLFVLLAVMYVLAIGWSYVKREHKPWSKLMTALTIGVFLYFFVTRQY